MSPHSRKHSVQQMAMNHRVSQNILMDNPITTNITPVHTMMPRPSLCIFISFPFKPFYNQPIIIRNITAAGAANKMLSKRSNIPPCPPSNVPESLRPA